MLADSLVWRNILDQLQIARQFYSQRNTADPQPTQSVISARRHEVINLVNEFRCVHLSVLTSNLSAAPQSQ